jgi:hypothetical protein
MSKASAVRAKRPTQVLTDAALDEIARLLAQPAYLISVQTLHLDPLWDPIRSDPRFQGRLRQYAGR